jgi:isopenicillin N synthase-like dioxygenase
MIPTIDIKPLFGVFGDDLQAKLNVAKQIDTVCRQTGFFQITNHGVENLEQLTSEAFRFFETLTNEEKMSMASKKFNQNNNHIYRGYFPASVNGKEGFDIGNPTIDKKSALVNLPFNEVCLLIIYIYIYLNLFRSI